MKTKTFALPVFFVLLWLYLLTLTSPDPAAASLSLPPSSPELSSPILFIENVGQFDERARFQVQGGNGTMWLAEMPYGSPYWPLQPVCQMTLPIDLIGTTGTTPEKQNLN